MLRSRAVAAQVVDSLQLQFRVKDPAGSPPLQLIAASKISGTFKPRTYEFTKQSNGRYAVRGAPDGKTYELTPGQSDSVDVGTIMLRSAGLPDRFTLKVEDHEEAIDRFTGRVTTKNAGGEIAK